MPEIYLDHAATTPLDPHVLEAMLPYLQEEFGNPSSFHTKGKRAADAIKQARETIATHLGARPDELIFTSSATEANNLAILGYARAHKHLGNHIITTSLEHHAVLETIMRLQKKEGFDVTYIKPNAQGLVDPQDVKNALHENTIFVSVMYVNNEIGTIQPIAEIGNIIHAFKQEKQISHLVFHTDACQAAGYLDMHVEKLHVDILTFNGSKIYGPKGIGLLYAKRGIKLEPLMFGGPQEKALRPGTEHVAGIIGLAKAFEMVQATKAKETIRLAALRDTLIQGILTTIPKTRLNGDAKNRLCNNVNISFMDIEGEALLLYLDAASVFASTGSACTSASLEPSHVILSLGLPYEVAHGSLRFTLGHSTTESDIDYVLATLPPLVEKLRSISPVSVDEKYFTSV